MKIYCLLRFSLNGAPRNNASLCLRHLRCLSLHPLSFPLSRWPSIAFGEFCNRPSCFTNGRGGLVTRPRVSLVWRIDHRPALWIYPIMLSSAARRKNLGFQSTSKAGTKVQEPKKLIPIHKARSRPISEQKRMFENAHNSVAVTRVIAVKVTALPEV